MTRFSSLEFDDAGGQPERHAGEPIRDERYFQDQAIRSCLHGDFELGLRNYSRALECNSHFLPGWAGQIRMLIELGEYKEAVIWADKAMELFPEHPEFLSHKATASFRDGRFDKAMAFSDHALSLDNPGPWVWLTRMEILLKQNRRIAETCIPKAVACAGPETSLIRLQAGRILSRYGYYACAMDLLSEAVRDFPKSPLAWYELGHCQHKLGQRNQARTSLEQAKILRPDWDLVDSESAAVEDRFWKRLLGRFF
ncbi:MAG TPA: tetratricopeptide repeat protein [Anaerohalosphaeraceae bacterium]|nr:tetratricopeptide repeat protein [Anaerohalosphaeraceae bacterium]